MDVIFFAIPSILCASLVAELILEDASDGVSWQVAAEFDEAGDGEVRHLVEAPFTQFAFADADPVRERNGGRHLVLRPGQNGMDGRDGAPGQPGTMGDRGAQGPAGPGGPAGMRGFDGLPGSGPVRYSP